MQTTSRHCKNKMSAQAYISYYSLHITLTLVFIPFAPSVTHRSTKWSSCCSNNGTTPVCDTRTRAGTTSWTPYTITEISGYRTRTSSCTVTSKHRWYRYTSRWGSTGTAAYTTWWGDVILRCKYDVFYAVCSAKSRVRANGYACPKLFLYKGALKYMKNKRSQKHTPYFHLWKGAAFLLVPWVEFHKFRHWRCVV